MKSIQLSHKPSAAPLYDFLSAHLPKSLCVDVICTGGGYGGGDAVIVEVQLKKKNGFLRRDQVIGTIDRASPIVRLDHPEYYSDIELVLRDYEKETGIEPTLEYWQSQKDSGS